MRKIRSDTESQFEGRVGVFYIHMKPKYTCWQVFIEHDCMNSDLQSRSGISYIISVLPVRHNFLSTPRPNCLGFYTCKMGAILIPFTGGNVINIIEIICENALEKH